ncbi:hypothetical protein AB0E27_31645 [Streptomyces sparsogenes]|uniref:hypothetical protein n=1 Tax=Streptomyces sparsogenes TaxID=67365 RepID=UPI0033E94D6C
MSAGFGLLLDEEIPDEREVMYPGKAVIHGPHLVEVDDEWVGLNHNYDCLDQYGETACEARQVEDWCYIEWADGLPDGRYWAVVEWVTTHYGYWDPPEEDAYLVPMYPEEVSEDA